MADFNRLFTQKAKEETPSHGSYKITWIHYSKLERSAYQYCDGKAEEIENLADMIAGAGKVLQSLIVRKGNDGNYEIVSGHKRCAAVKLLVEERGLKHYEMLPCVISSESEEKIRYTVVSSNTYHEKTPYEIMHELKELEYLIRNYPDEFPDLKGGRMVERLAKKTGMAKSVVGEYQAIAKNLSATAMDKFRQGDIDKSAASALAGLPADEQDQLLEASVTRGKDIKAYKKEKSKAAKEQPAKKLSVNAAKESVPADIPELKGITREPEDQNNKRFTCTGEDGAKHWEGKLSIKCRHSYGFEVEISGRGSSFYAVIGKYSYGNYLCIPSLNIGCALANYSDFVWNKEHLEQVMRTPDAITVATALKHL